MTTDVRLGSTRTFSPAAVCETTDGCITCGDVAVILTVVSVTDSDALCRDDEGATESVAVELVGAVAVGDQLLVHAGVALERLTGKSDNS